MGWDDPALTAALTDLTGGGIDDAAATAARQQVAQVLQVELPVIPVAWYRQSVVVSDRVDGVVLDPLERSFHLTDVRWAR
jgi:peptide/nickel transport system substrate-binding protein